MWENVISINCLMIFCIFLPNVENKKMTTHNQSKLFTFFSEPKFDKYRQRNA